MNIEEIKKEIKNTFYIDEDNMHFEVAEINIDILFEILDKYKDQDKYKNAWEYMFEWFNKRNAKRDTPKSLEIENFVIEFMQEIEKMNGIEVK